MRAEATATSGFQLIWGITRRMIGWGLVMGALLGAIYGPLAGGGNLEFGLTFGLIIGGVAGGLLGAVDGLVMSVLSLITFHSVKKTRKSQLAMAFTAVVTTFATVILVALLAERTLQLSILAPGIIAALASGYAGWRVAAWAEPRLVSGEERIRS